VLMRLVAEAAVWLADVSLWCRGIVGFVGRLLRHCWLVVVSTHPKQVLELVDDVVDDFVVVLLIVRSLSTTHSRTQQEHLTVNG